jgi:hypothetical protein
MRPGCIRNQIRSCRTVRCLAFLGWGRSWLRVPMFARVRLRHWHVGGRINVFDRRRGWYRNPGALDPVIGSGGHDIRIHQHHQQLHQRRLVDRRIPYSLPSTSGWFAEGPTFCMVAGWRVRPVRTCIGWLIIEHEGKCGEAWDVVEEARWMMFVCDGVCVDLGCSGVGMSVDLFGVVLGTDEGEDGDHDEGADDAARWCW